MDQQFDVALKTAHGLLKTKGAIAALHSIRTFFEENQGSIKAYFDTKSLEETAEEMKSRLTQINALISDIQEEQPDEVSIFMKGSCKYCDRVKLSALFRRP